MCLLHLGLNSNPWQPSADILPLAVKMADALSKGAGVTRRTSTVLPLLEDQSPAILACISHSPEFIKALFSAVFRILRFFFPAEGDSHKRAFYDEMEDPCITTAWNTESLKTPRP